MIEGMDLVIGRLFLILQVGTFSPCKSLKSKEPFVHGSEREVRKGQSDLIILALTMEKMSQEPRNTAFKS